MGLNLNLITSEQDYQELIDTMLDAFEGTKQYAYADSNGYPTIGIGFRIDNANIDYILEGMGYGALAKTKPSQYAALKSVILEAVNGYFAPSTPDEIKYGTSVVRVIVKSGVWQPELSGVLIDVCHLDPISEFDSGDHLCKVIEAAQSSPGLLGTQADLEHHVQHAVAGQAAFGALGPMADRPEGGFDRVAGPNALPVRAGKS